MLQIFGTVIENGILPKNLRYECRIIDLVQSRNFRFCVEGTINENDLEWDMSIHRFCVIEFYLKITVQQRQWSNILVLDFFCYCFIGDF